MNISCWEDNVGYNDLTSKHIAKEMCMCKILLSFSLTMSMTVTYKSCLTGYSNKRGIKEENIPELLFTEDMFHDKKHTLKA